MDSLLLNKGMAMNLEKERKWIISQVKKVEDEATIVELRRVLELETGHISSELRESIKRGQQQDEAGDLHPHSEAEKIYKGWRAG